MLLSSECALVRRNVNLAAWLLEGGGGMGGMGVGGRSRGSNLAVCHHQVSLLTGCARKHTNCPRVHLVK